MLSAEVLHKNQRRIEAVTLSAVFPGVGLNRLSRPCALYERSTRSAAQSVSIRRQTCEDSGCCFAPRRNNTDLECYAKPEDSDWWKSSKWTPLAWEKCTKAPHDVCLEQADRNTKTRENICAKSDGTISSRSAMRSC